MASRKRQWECKSIVLTGLPLRMTGLRFVPRFGCLCEPCAYAASIKPHVQNTRPDAAAPLMNSLRVVIARLSVNSPDLQDLSSMVYESTSFELNCPRHG